MAASEVSTRVAREHQEPHPEYLQWAIVRHVDPVVRWEDSFESIEDLGKFRAPFKPYMLLDAPKSIDLVDFLCVMRSNAALDQSLTCFAKHLDYLQKNNYSYLLTVQRVHAALDPRKLDSHILSRINGALGIHNKYVLEEYCLVRDMVLTQHDRHHQQQQRRRPPSPLAQPKPKTKTHAKAKVTSDVMSESHDVEEITSSDSAESSKKSLPTEAAAEYAADEEASRSHSHSRSHSRSHSSPFVPPNANALTASSSSTRAAYKKGFNKFSTHGKKKNGTGKKI